MESFAESVTSSIVSSIGHVTTFPLFLIYFLTGKDLYQPIDFRRDVIDGNKSLNLIEGVIFHYKGKNEIPTLGSIFLQYLYDILISSSGIFLLGYHMFL